MKIITNILIKLITGYQFLISPLLGNSCRYLPTCSEYARWQFENNSFFKAIYFTITRILSCNKLFPGGFHYPKVKCKRNSFNLIKSHKEHMPDQIKKIKYWYIPQNKKCLVTKNWEYKK